MASQAQKRYICVAFCFRWILRVHRRRERDTSVPRQSRDHPTPRPDPLPILLVLCVWAPRLVLPSLYPRVRYTACPSGSMCMGSQVSSTIILTQGHSHWFYVYGPFLTQFRIPTRPGKPGKMRVHLEISWNFENFNKYLGKMT